MNGFVGRAAAAFILLVPIAVIDLLCRQPLAISAIASTAAIVLHAPARYHLRPQLIVGCYVVAIVVAAPMAVAGQAWGAPAVLMGSVTAALIAATPAGRAHPPVACVPLAAAVPAVSTVALMSRWALLAGTAAYSLGVLWLLSAQLVRAQSTSECSATCSRAVQWWWFRAGRSLASSKLGTARGHQ